MDPELETPQHRENFPDRPDAHIAFVGDGNNVAASWINAARRLPIRFTLVCPPGHEPDADWMKNAVEETDGRVNVEHDPAAAVALFLSRMTTSVSAVPDMHREMQVMNTHMSAMPAIVAEMHAINAKLSVMTAAMDSTMGRTGRMAPWMPFSR